MRLELVVRIKFILKEGSGSTETRLMRKIASEMQNLGYSVDLESNFENYDAVIANGVGVWQQTAEYLRSKKKSPLFIYEWDCYPWAYPNNLNYFINKWSGYPVFPKNKYRKILAQADRIFCPSTSVVKRIGQIFNFQEKCEVIFPFFEPILAGSQTDRGYIYHPVRKYKDNQFGWLEKFSRMYKIPILRPEHGLNKEEYEEAVLNASLIVTEYREASTGGLTLLEAFERGKKILFCDSEYMGANDYFPRSDVTFEEGSFEDFSNKILMKMETDNTATKEDMEYIRNKFSVTETTNQICSSIAKYLKEIN
jgi:hypothetical protein